MTTGSSKKSNEFDTKAMKEIMGSLPDLVKVKIGQWSSTKSLWERIQKIYIKDSAFVSAIPDRVLVELKHKDNQESKEVDEGTNCIKEDDYEYNFEIEVEVDLKEKLVVSLEEISRLKKGKWRTQ